MLKPIERDLAVWRIEQEAGVGEAHEQISTTRGFLLALKDIKVRQNRIPIEPVLT